MSTSSLQLNEHAAANEPSPPLPNGRAVEVRACWNEIGVLGNATCPDLQQLIHCQNCPVYSKTGVQLLDRPLLPEYRRAWTEQFAQKKQLASPARHSALLFRIDAEWLALPTPAFQEVAEPRPVHSLPNRRRGSVLGLVNVRGELLICVSLGHLLGLDKSPSRETPSRAYARLLVAKWDGHRFVFPTDEVCGILRFQTPELQEPPAILAKSRLSYTQGIIHYQDRSVGLLDANLLFFVPQPESDVNKRTLRAPGNLSMLELFRVEAENQTAILTSGLLELDRSQGAPRQLEILMRAAHSLKGAARIVNLQQAVRVTHAMEDCFALAQQGQLALRQAEIDLLFRGVDLLLQISKYTEANIARWEADHAEGIRQLLNSLVSLKSAAAAPAPIASQAAAHTEPVAAGSSTGTDQPVTSFLPAAMEPAPPEVHSQAVATRPDETPERMVRLTAENLNRLLGLAGESLVESRWLRPFSNSLMRLKRQHAELSGRLDDLRQHFSETDSSGRAEQQLNELAYKVDGCQQFLANRLQELDLFDRRSAHLSQRLYLEVLRTRMRPFSDGVRHFPRMVRDLARATGKEVQLEIIGENTPVDRDILERLESPLAHLLRNAVDHGCETPEQRQRAGKSPEGTIRLEARHSAGLLLVTVTDDGAGVQPGRVREAILKRKLVTPAVAEKLTDAELLEFLFLPGFTLKETVTEISGRGVGLDVVQNMVRSVRGNLRVSKQLGSGLRVQLQLPLTLSVLRALLVEVAGEPYAFPLTQITRALKLQPESIETLEGRHHFNFHGQQVGLVTAHQVFDCSDPKPPAGDLLVIVVGDRDSRYGLVVDRLLGERELVVQPLDARLGKINDISAAALMEDGTPVLIVDVDDLVQSIEQLLSKGLFPQIQRDDLKLTSRKRKRVLVVDDSLTVRELVRKLLANRGYLADVAVDGMDGWNAVSAGHYDLVIADVDMPRLDGAELVALIKKDPRLKSLAVMIVSYKDREEDRLRGLEAGADYYLTKAAFHDETLLQAVVDLIGDPDT